MPIQNNMTYSPIISSLEKEEDMILLLQDVRESISAIDSKFKFSSLKKIVEVVSKQYFNSEPKDGIINSVDLGMALGYVNTYKTYSGKGCRACVYEKSFKPLQDETCFYCSLDEKQEDCFKKGNSLPETFSPIISKYNFKGCENQKPRFKPLEEII